MSDIDQTHIDELNERLGNINSELAKLASLNSAAPPVESSKTRVAFTATATRLKMEAGALFNTMNNGTGSLSSYSSSVTGVTDTIASLLGSFGVFSKMAGVAIQAFGALAARFLDGSQELIKASDSLEKYSMNLGLVPTELRRQAHASKRFHTKNIEQYAASLQTLGGASLYLGKTTGEGATEFNKIAKVSDTLIDEFVMLGVEPGKLRDHFATYIDLESKLGFQQYRGAEEEQKRATTFTKNLYAMAALTGESVETLTQKYQSMRNDIQYNAKLALLRSHGKAELADKIDNFLMMAKTIMGESTAKGYKDFIVNNGALLTKEGQAEAASSMGRMFMELHSLLTDPTASPTKVLSALLEQKGKSFDIFRSALQYASSEDANQLGFSGQAVTAAMAFKSGKSLEQIMADAKAVAASGDKLATARAKQLKMEATANIALDQLASIAEKPMSNAFTLLYHTVKTAAKVFAWGAGVFGFKEFEKSINDLFASPEELQQTATESTLQVDKLSEQIAAKKDNVEKLKKDLDEKRKSGKHTQDQLNVLSKKIAEEEAQVEKMRLEQIAAETKMREAWKKFGQTPEGQQYVNDLDRQTSNKSLKTVADVIGHYESGEDGYSALVGKRNTLREAASFDKKNGTSLESEITGFLANIQQKTISEVLAFQEKINSTLHVGTAIGRYQFVKKTLKELVTQMTAIGALSYSDTFDAQTQDKILMFKLDKLGFKTIRDGQATEAEKKAFIGKVSKVWAGIGKDESDTGSYDNYNGNKAGKGSYKAMSDALNTVPKYKIGGIASGPKSGFDVELHGAEAVVPMKNSTLPVLMNFPTINAVDIATPKFTTDVSKVSAAIAKLKVKKQAPKTVAVQSPTTVSSDAVKSNLDTLLALVNATAREIDKSTDALTTAAKHFRV